MADRKRESNQIGYLASNGRDLYVTARRRGCNGSGDAIDMLLNKRPLGAARCAATPSRR